MESCHQRLSAIALFHGFDQTGQYLLVNESIDDLVHIILVTRSCRLIFRMDNAVFKKTFRVTIIPALQERDIQMISTQH